MRAKPAHLKSVVGGGDLRMNAQLLYDGSCPTLFDSHHRDIREPPAAGLENIKKKHFLWQTGLLELQDHIRGSRYVAEKIPPTRGFSCLSHKGAQ